jgi:hypothetical protein
MTKSTRKHPVAPGSTRRSRAQIERLEHATGLAWHTIYRVARERGHKIAQLTDARIIAMARWHVARVGGAGGTRRDSTLRRVPCDYCGRVGPARGRPWRYDYELDAVVCARGEGCSARKPEDEREARAPNGNRTREYRDSQGHWYTIQQIADLAGIRYPAAYQRMWSGWTVEDAIRPIGGSHQRPQYFSRMRRALDAAAREAV